MQPDSKTVQFVYVIFLRHYNLEIKDTTLSHMAWVQSSAPLHFLGRDGVLIYKRDKNRPPHRIIVKIQ